MSEIANDSRWKAYNVKQYLDDVMQGDVQSFVRGEIARTRYENMDAITSLYPGLYVLGGISSLGKTTFAHQMCDQLAQQGEHVVYFSLEQSILELVSKSLSRITALDNRKNAMTSLDIRKHGADGRVLNAIESYKRYAKNITIAECGLEAGIGEVEAYVRRYVKENAVKPVVVIDYLQVMQCDEVGVTAKERVESVVCRLKRMQEEHNIVVIVISSLNRQSYLSPIDFESFKESGGIEYTADVVWGLQLEIMHDPIFDSPSKLLEKRQMIQRAKKTTPRRVELCCIKNRFGVSSYTCMFDYFPEFDLFAPDLSK